MSLSVMKADSTRPNSATAPLGIAGAWTVQDRKDQARGRLPGRHLWTAPTRTNGSAPKLTVSTTETASRPPVQRGILSWEPMSLSVTRTGSIYLNNAMAPLGIAGASTAQDRNEPGLGQAPALLRKTAVNPMNRCVPKLTANTTETASSPTRSVPL